MPLTPNDLSVLPFGPLEPLDERVFANLKVALSCIEKPTVFDLLVITRDLYFSFMDDGLEDAEWDLAFSRAEILNTWLTNRQRLHE